MTSLYPLLLVYFLADLVCSTNFVANEHLLVSQMNTTTYLLFVPIWIIVLVTRLCWGWPKFCWIEKCFWTPALLNFCIFAGNSNYAQNRVNWSFLGPKSIPNSFHNLTFTFFWNCIFLAGIEKSSSCGFVRQVNIMPQLGEMGHFWAQNQHFWNEAWIKTIFYFIKSFLLV